MPLSDEERRARSRERSRRYYEEHKERLNRQSKEYRERLKREDPEGYRERRRRYNEKKDPEKAREWARESYRRRREQRGEEMLETKRAYRSGHREQLRASNRRWYRRHQEEEKFKARERYRLRRLAEGHVVVPRPRLSAEERLRREERRRACEEERSYRLSEVELSWVERRPDRAAVCKYRRRFRKFHNGGSSGKEKLEQRSAVWGHRCWMCGSAVEAMDHVKPIARGGSSWPSNMRPICRSCNSKKGDRWPTRRPMRQFIEGLMCRPRGSGVHVSSSPP
jgi:5-methylcytosine-specific restriction endonuclease McrA